MATNPTAIDINGYALRMIRVRSGVGVAELAEQIGKTRSYVAKIELGHNKRVSPETYKALLDALQIEDHRTLLVSPHAEAVSA